MQHFANINIRAYQEGICRQGVALFGQKIALNSVFMNNIRRKEFCQYLPHKLGSAETLRPSARMCRRRFAADTKSCVIIMRTLDFFVCFRYCPTPCQEIKNWPSVDAGTVKNPTRGPMAVFATIGMGNDRRPPDDAEDGRDRQFHDGAASKGLVATPWSRKGIPARLGC